MRQRSKLLVPFALTLIALASVPAFAQDATLEEGYTLLEDSEYRKAWARFQEVATAQGVSHASLLGMSRAAIPLGEYAVAADLADQAAQIAGGVRERVDAQTLLGRAHMEATFFSPEHVAAEKAAGVGYLDRAVEHYSAAIAESQALASEASYWLALCHLERGENELASKAAGTYLQQRPDGEFAGGAKAVQEAAAERADSDITPPSAKRKFRPDYAGKAREQGVRGMIIAQGVVDTQGHFSDVVLLKGIEPGLDQRLLKQISRVRYEPAQVDGQPTTIHHRVFLPIRGRGSDPARQIIPVQ